MRHSICLLLAISMGALAHAQQPSPSSPELISQVPPVYPAIARAAHISGAVSLDIKIDTTGHVAEAKTVSGPPMLVGAAIDAVKQWTYKPTLKDGVPVEKVARVYVNFNMPPAASPDDEKIAAQYFPASETCRAAFRETEPAKAADACSKAAEIAANFSDQERFIERRSAYTYASSATLRNKQLDRAYFYAEKAVTVVLQGHDDGSGSNAAYSVRAQAKAAIGDLTGADADLSAAEDFERKAIQNISKDAPQLVQHEYLPTLKNQLLFHARVLDALHNSAAANAKREEAAKL